MFSSNNYITDVNDVPSSWIFENYLNLESPLDGNRIRIRSIFNDADKTPSMFIYYNRDCKCYKYKCFSTGRGGSAVDLMMYIWSTDFKDASVKIINDYSEFLKTGQKPVKENFEVSNWRVGEYELRSWTTLDAKYWTKFNIGSDLLEQYNVAPINHYCMEKVDQEENIIDSFQITGHNIYGFFTKEGELYKIYQPYNKSRKFIKITDYIQGEDQLENNKFLVIASSLKDIMAIKSLGLKIDAVAPHSENTLLSEHIMNKYKKQYKGIATVLDSDAAGIKAMKEYEEKYGVPFCYLPLEKDISDIVKHHGKDVALYELNPKLNKAFDKYVQKI